MGSQKIGFVGGGQLAQMIAEAGEKLDVSFRSAASSGSCAFSSCEPFTQPLASQQSIDAFLNDIDVFTFESEHEGLDIAAHATQRSIPVRPPAEFVQTAGDRLLEKTLLADLNIPTAPFIEIPATSSEDEISGLLVELINTLRLSPAGIVVKTRRGGYDGKGQWVLTSRDQVAAAAREIYPLINEPGCIVEGLVQFSLECSILASRSVSGEMATWPLTHNVHRESILRYSYSPITDIEDVENLEAQARVIVNTLCDESNYVGTIAVECFVTENGLVVNEIAPRVHNSGHWTIEGSDTSQFEQHVRAITDQELGSTESQGFSAMVNLVGFEVHESDFTDKDNIYLHWYGKEVRPARKVGHITVVGQSIGERDDLVTEVLNLLKKSRDDI